MLADLERSGLTAEDAKRLAMEPLATKATAAATKQAAGRASYRIPYFDLHGKPTKFHRLRFVGSGHADQLADPPPKYVQPSRTAPELYLPPLPPTSWNDVARDPSIELVITEGEKKAAAACKHGVYCIGLGGVWSWSAGDTILESLAAFEWKGRRVSILYDADAARNAQVVNAASRLGAELVSLGAEAHVGFLPAGGPKGIDDLIVAQGPDALRAVVADLKPLRRGLWPLDMAVPSKIFPHVQRDAKGRATRPLATIESVRTLLDFYGIEVSYNEITKVPLYRGRDMDTSSGGGVQHGAVDSALNRIVSQARLCGMATDDLHKTVVGIAYEHPVNPVREYLTKLAPPRPGETDAILTVARKFTVPQHEEEIRDAVFRLWMIQACAAADYAQQTPIAERRPHGRARPTFEYVLTLLGRQGVCKTSTLRSLVPIGLREYFGAGVHLNPENKDSIERATGFWITELGEIDGTVGKAAAASMKAFLSQTTDVYRKSYGRERNAFPRQTVFAATGNILRSLRDVTGSRRFWPLNVVRVEPLTDAEVERAWAEAWALYLAGEQWWPTHDLQQRLDAQVIAYAEEFPLGERVIEVFGSLTQEAKRRRGTEYLSAFKILGAVGVQPDPGNPRDVAAARELGNWLARVNVDASGQPDRRARAGTSEWRMPKREPRKFD
jgi:putative DNA primase/helicase